LGFAIAAAFPAASALADAGAQYLATGGGELVLNQTQPGPGTTIAFTARQVEPGSDVADGVVEEKDHTSGTIANGRVFCMHVEGNTAVIAYRPRQANALPSEYHQLFVMDNGEGPADDLIFSDRSQAPTPPCAFSAPQDSPNLGRGNVQIQRVN
jgi:hypothetical protein